MLRSLANRLGVSRIVLLPLHKFGETNLTSCPGVRISRRVNRRAIVTHLRGDRRPKLTHPKLSDSTRLVVWTDRLRGDAGSADDCTDASGASGPREVDPADRAGVEVVAQHGSQAEPRRYGGLRLPVIAARVDLSGGGHPAAFQVRVTAYVAMYRAQASIRLRRRSNRSERA